MKTRAEVEAGKRAQALKAGIGGGPLSFVCPACGGDWHAGNTYVPHAEDCPKYQREREQQDAEAAVLRNVRAPFPVTPKCSRCGLAVYLTRSGWRHRAEMVIPRHKAEAPRESS